MTAAQRTLTIAAGFPGLTESQASAYRELAQAGLSTNPQTDAAPDRVAPSEQPAGSA